MDKEDTYPKNSNGELCMTTVDAKERKLDTSIK